MYTFFIFVVFFGVWLGCAGTGGVLGFMLGWMPAWVIVHIFVEITG